MPRFLFSRATAHVKLEVDHIGGMSVLSPLKLSCQPAEFHQASSKPGVWCRWFYHVLVISALKITVFSLQQTVTNIIYGCLPIVAPHVCCTLGPYCIYCTKTQLLVASFSPLANGEPLRPRWSSCCGAQKSYGKSSACRTTPEKKIKKKQQQSISI